MEGDLYTMENSPKDYSLPFLTDNLPHPPTPTPTPHHLHCRVFSLTGHNSPRRSSIDTPLSLYASTRARLREELEAYTSAPTRRQNTVHQVPLSALCPPQAVPGAVGGPFNSTTKVKSLPLPTVFNRYQLTSRGIRRVGLHTDRYLPVSTTKRRWTITDSLLNLSKLRTRQKEHLLHTESGISHSRRLQRDREVVPHRVEQSYYMNGQSAQLFKKEEIPQTELDALQTLALSQNKHLYYGKGIRSTGGRASDTVKRFEHQLQESILAQTARNYKLEDIDLRRHSRASRTVTPGSPLIEEEEEDSAPEQPTSRETSSNKTFMTQQTS